MPGPLRHLGDAKVAVEALKDAIKEDFDERLPAVDIAVDWGTYHRIQLGTFGSDFKSFSPLANVPVSGARDWFGALRVMGETKLPSNPDPNVSNSPDLRLMTQGDSYVQVVDFDPRGPVKAKALLIYGNESRPGSSHITDQLPIFTAKTLRPVLREWAEVVQNAESNETYP